jgi:hypothetical protein
MVASTTGVVKELRKALAVDGWAVVREPEEKAVLRY